MDRTDKKVRICNFVDSGKVNELKYVYGLNSDHFVSVAGNHEYNHCKYGKYS